MNRRQFLASTTAASTTLLTSGCLGILGGGDNGGEPIGPISIDQIREANSLGEPVEYGGLNATVSGYKTADAYAKYNDYRDYDNNPPREDELTEPPAAGGVFLLVRTVIEHVGDGKLFYPLPRNVQVTYNGRRVEAFDLNHLIYANGRTYTPYTHEVYDSQAVINGAYNGYVLDAWRVVQVPVSFDPGLTALTIRWAGTANNTMTASWRLGNFPQQQFTTSE